MAFVAGWLEIGHAAAPKELRVLRNRFDPMSEAIDKLRQLARQSRTLSREAADRQRSAMLRGLAQLYEEQALQLESGAGLEPFAAEQLG